MQDGKKKSSYLSLTIHASDESEFKYLDSVLRDGVVGADILGNERLKLLCNQLLEAMHAGRKDRVQS